MKQMEEQLRIGTTILGDSCQGSPQYSDGKVRGIPLTEEWLLKLGFVKTHMVGSQTDFKKDRIAIGYVCNQGPIFSTPHVFLDEDNELVFFHQRLKYVHEVQDLYYATHRRKLKIK